MDLTAAIANFRDLLEAERAPSNPTYTYDAQLHSPSASGGKKWNISVKDNHVTTSFGPKGGWTQTKVKVFDSVDKAMSHAHKMVNKKGKKGYSTSRDHMTTIKGTMPKGKTWAKGAPEPGKKAGSKSKGGGLVDMTGDVMKALGAKTATAKAKAKSKKGGLTPAQLKMLRSKTPKQSAASMDKKTAALKSGAKGKAPASHTALIKSIKSRPSCCKKSPEAVAATIRAKMGGKKGGKKAKRGR